MKHAKKLPIEALTLHLFDQSEFSFSTVNVTGRKAIGQWFLKFNGP